VFYPQTDCILKIYCAITLAGEDHPSLDDTGGNDFEVSNLAVAAGRRRARYNHPLATDAINPH